MTFHDLLLVSNETTNLACCTVNTLFVYSLALFLFFLFQCLRTKKKSFRFFVPCDLPLIYMLSLL